MGSVKATGHIGLSQEALQDVEFLVDTKSVYPFPPPAMAADFGITLPFTSRVRTADSGTVEIRVGVVYLRLIDREGGIIVGSMDVPMPLLGASALKFLGLKVNPVDRPWSIPDPSARKPCEGVA